MASAATSGVTTLADTWLWTATGWTLASAVGPPARSGAALAFDPGAGVPVLFGGAATRAGSGTAQAVGGYLGVERPVVAARLLRTPALRPGIRRSWPPMSSTGGVVLFGGSGSRGDLSDTWLWDGTNWSAVRPAGSLSPRVDAASAFDATTQKLLVFGGVGSSGPSSAIPSCSPERPRWISEAARPTDRNRLPVP